MTTEIIDCPFCLGKHHIEIRPFMSSVFVCMGRPFSMNWWHYENVYIPHHHPAIYSQIKIYNALLRQRAVRLIEANRNLKPGNDTPFLNYEEVFEHDQLPNPVEQADRLLLYIGENTKFSGIELSVSAEEINDQKKLAYMLGAVGAIDIQNIVSLVEDLKEDGFLKGFCGSKDFCVSLTHQGWKKYAALQRPNKESKYVFLAMKFVKEQQEFLKEKLSPMLQTLGLELKLLPEIPSKENLIDNQLRVAIRQSRLLICDLTHGNQGAYWEAGYAEGLGLPVIYIGEQEILESEDKEIRPHFDVSHQQIIPWIPGNDESIKKFVSDVQAKIQMVL